MIKHKVDTAYPPQMNGQVEVSNWEIKSIFERTMSINRKYWPMKLDDALWSFKTPYKTSIGTFP